jgi:hypothetical protein
MINQLKFGTLKVSSLSLLKMLMIIGFKVSVFHKIHKKSLVDLRINPSKFGTLKEIWLNPLIMLIMLMLIVSAFQQILKL